MKEELQEELLNSIEVVKTYLQQGAELAAQEAPLLIQEIIQFAFWSNFAGLMFATSAIIAAFGWWWMGAKYPQGESYSFLGLFSFATGCISGFFFARHFLKAWLAPRLYLIEYLKDFL